MPERSIETIRLEGPLFVHDILRALFADKDLRPGSANAPVYPLALPPGTRLNDEIGRAFSIASAAWRAFLAQRDAHPQSALHRFLLTLFRDALAYSEQTFALSSPGLPETAPSAPELAFRLPLAPLPVFSTLKPETTLDAPDRRFSSPSDGLPPRRRSLSQFVQQWLNLRPDALWALATDGRTIRLFRDNASLTRPAFLEFDLERILSEGRYADFACLFYILHRSRAGAAPDASDSLWETLRTKGAAEGVRVFEALRDGVVRALLLLGNGFLAAPSIRAAFADGTLDDASFFRQLLHTAYRFLFLFAAEERDALHPPPGGAGGPPPDGGPGAEPPSLARTPSPREIYASGYSMRRLADRSRRSASRTAHTDLWEGVRIVFRSLATGEPRLALPALGGLFRTDQAPDLDAAPLSNRALLDAVRALRWTQTRNAEQRVDYRNLGAEELGSVYESLLELVPSVSLSDWRFAFLGIPDPFAPAAPSRSRGPAVAGNSRKTSGSYYTPAPLVDQLVRSTIDPLLESRLKDLRTPAERETALLSLAILDPACGSGHFLLAAARRIAERLAQVRSGDDDVLTAASFRTALRDVVSHCIYGTDLNPLALELAKTALWLETLVPGQPLSFLDAHFACGNAVLGVLDLKTLPDGIPDDAYALLSGDDRETCTALKRKNRDAIRQRRRDTRQGSQQLSLLDPGLLENDLSRQFAAIDAMPEDTLDQIEAKRAAHLSFLSSAATGPLANAANLYVSAFLLPKTASSAPDPQPSLFPTDPPSPSGTGDPVPPTSADIFATLGFPGFPPPDPDTLSAAATAAQSARALHWPLAFPAVFAKGGFDAVLGNPPWDVLQISEKEFFETRNPQIARLAGASRKRAIEALQTTDPHLWSAYQTALRNHEHTVSFIAPSGRFKLSAHGKLNLYALFTELASQLLRSEGRAGLVLPSGIASDDSTKALFSSLVRSHRIESLISFENEELTLFPSIHHSFKFCLLSLGHADSADFAFFLRNVPMVADSRRHFSLTPEDFALLNPNTLTCPVFRTARDAELAKKIYHRTGVLWSEDPPANPWGIHLWTMFNLTTDSYLFQTAPSPSRLPLYEAKMIGIFDHRYNAFDNPGQEDFHLCTDSEKTDPDFEPTPRYWVEQSAVAEAFVPPDQDPNDEPPPPPPYLMGWRDITNASTYRSTIASVFPLTGVGNSLPLIFTSKPPALSACLLGDLNSLVHDWVARQKISGVHLNFFMFKQIATLPPEAYTPEDIDYIVPRVLELTYTSNSLRPWAAALGYHGAPFPWDEDRRALLRAELDARYARLYGLSRDDLRYILDPKSVMGPDFPSESFRVLQDSELRRFGEYRTARLVMSAWQEQELAEITTYVRQATPFAEPDTRKDYLKFLIRQMLRDTYSETLSVSELYAAWAALSDPARMAANKDMPAITKAWAAQFKDAIRDGDNLEDILVRMCADKQISISKHGLVSLRRFPLNESSPEVPDISMDASLALLYSRKMRETGESVRCELSDAFVQHMENGDFEYVIAA